MLSIGQQSFRQIQCASVRNVVFPMLPLQDVALFLSVNEVQHTHEEHFWTSVGAGADTPRFRTVLCRERARGGRGNYGGREGGGKRRTTARGGLSCKLVRRLYIEAPLLYISSSLILLRRVRRVITLPIKKLHAKLLTALINGHARGNVTHCCDTFAT